MLSAAELTGCLCGQPPPPPPPPPPPVVRAASPLLAPPPPEMPAGKTLLLVTESNALRRAASINPQASPVRAGLIPGKAPFVASPLAPPVPRAPTVLVTPKEPACRC